MSRRPPCSRPLRLVVPVRRMTSRALSVSWFLPPLPMSRVPPCISTAVCSWIDYTKPRLLVKPQRFFSYPRGEGVFRMDNIVERVKKIVAEQLGVNEADIKNESSFVDDLGADSLDTVELVMALEEEFECEIPDEEAEKITSVQQAIDYVTAHLKK